MAIEEDETLKRREIKQLKQQVAEDRAARVRAEAKTVHKPATRNPKKKSKKQPEHEDSSNNTNKRATSRKKNKESPRRVIKNEPLVHEEFPKDDEMDNESTVFAQGQEEEDEETYTFHEEHLMSTNTPHIVDCSSRIGMLLVEWFKTPTSNSRQA
eukprot:scaffold76348_cov29-Attheya_sp.AAC.2